MICFDHVLLQMFLLLLLPMCCLALTPHELAALFEAEEQLEAVVQQLLLTEEVMMLPSGESKLTVVKEVAASWRAGWASRYRELPSQASSRLDTQQHQAAVMERLVGNPVQVFCLLERLVRLVPAMTGLPPPVLALAVQVPNWPAEADWEEAALALARLQFVYQLDPTALAAGRVGSRQTEARLRPAHLATIAELLLSGRAPLRPGLGPQFALAVIWAEAGLELEAGAGERGRLERVLGRARALHDTHWVDPADQRGNYPNEEFFLRRMESSSVTGLQLRAEEGAFLDSQQEATRLNQKFHLHDFYSLCRGEAGRGGCGQGLCRLEVRDPAHLLAPLHREELCTQPPVILYHDFLTYQESGLLTELVVARNKLMPAVVEEGRLASVRTQASGWLEDNLHPTFHHLSRRVGRMTGLEVARPSHAHSPAHQGVEAEPWQVGVYGPGGHYLPHWDSFTSLPDSAWADGEWVGNRLATVMFYLTDLQGGRTAFPRLGVAATPRAGTAVFWYNLQEDGRRDERSLHGACPTLLGIKWVSNKWIREGASIWRRPCVEPDNYSVAAPPAPVHSCNVSVPATS